jgi:hypothetical protein
MLDELAAQDPGGYPHQWQVHAGLPHWMDLADAVAIPFAQQHVRDPAPPRVVWLQADVPHTRFYWLSVAPEDARPGTQVIASYSGDVVVFEQASGLARITVRLSDAMLDLDRAVRVELGGRELFAGTVPRTIGALARSLAERNDPTMMLPGELSVELTP